MKNIVRWTVLALFVACAASFAGAQSLASLRSIPGLQPGSVLVLSLVGDASGGQVWGTGVYTSDSSLQAAAVHSGALGHKQAGTVVVEVLPGESSYRGSSSNGVSSSGWGAYALSFRFQDGQGAPVAHGPEIRQPKAAPARVYGFDDPDALGRLVQASGPSLPGTVTYMLLTGSTSGRVWGTDVYTIDSSPAAASVHAGALAPGQTGVVRITFLEGMKSYQGSSRGGVLSMPFGSYGASYSVESIEGDLEFVPLIPDPGIVARIPGAAPGQTYGIWVRGNAQSGAIWGSGTYTADSTLAKAAVHSGVLQSGASGPVIVRVLPGQPSYRGSTSNGVSSSSYGAYGLSYAIESAR